jgi:hypothetical protein
MCAIDFNCDVRNWFQSWCAQLISIVMCAIDFNCDVRHWFQLWCAQLISIVMCVIDFNCDVRNWFQLWCAQFSSIVMCTIEFNCALLSCVGWLNYPYPTTFTSLLTGVGILGGLIIAEILPYNKVRTYCCINFQATTNSIKGGTVYFTSKYQTSIKLQSTFFGSHNFCFTNRVAWLNNVPQIILQRAVI